MSETVDALGYKADVKSRAKESIVGVKDRIAGSTPDTGDVKDKARQARSVAQENPLGLAIGAVAVGFVAGLLIPSTRVEDEKIGSVADDVKDKIKETGQEAVERGKQVAQDAAETAKESGQEHAQELKDSAQQNTQDVGERPQYTAR
jgi:gas vesicle protein